MEKPHLPLLYGIVATYDFSSFSLAAEFNEEERSRIAFFRGDGLFEYEERQTKPILVRYEKDGDEAPKTFHSKLRLYCYEGNVYRLYIGSKNLYPYQNLEAGIWFEGEWKQGEIKKNEPLLDLLSLLCSFLKKDDQKEKAILKQAIKDLPHIDFHPLGDGSFLSALASKAKDIRFVTKSFENLGLFASNYDELLLIAPFIQGEALKDYGGKKATHYIVSSPSTIEELLHLGFTKERYLTFFGAPFVHAKMYLGRKGDRFDLYLGSMNLTSYSIKKNDELMIELSDIPLEGGIPSFLSSIFALPLEEAETLLRKEEGKDLLSRACSYKTRQSYYLSLHEKGKYQKEEDLKALSYLFSSECLKNLTSLILGDEFPYIPKRKDIEVGRKQRTVYSLPLLENLTLGLINHALHFDAPRFSKNVFLHIQGRGVKDVFRKIREEEGFKDYYLFRSDIHAFDPSMKEDVLLEAIERFYKDDPMTKRFLCSYVKAKAYEQNEIIHHDGPAQYTGLPLGGILENLYLDDFDKAIESFVPFYVRCGDDILLGSKNKETVEKAKEEVEKRLNEKGLTLSEKKTSFLSPSEPFSFLGYDIKGDCIDIEEKHLIKITKDIRKKKKALLRHFESKGIIPFLRLPYVISFLNRFIKEFDLKSIFRIITTPKSLKKIDEEVLDLIREVASGSKGKAKYKISTQQLHLFGYRTLVNSYYRHIDRNKS